MDHSYSRHPTMELVVVIVILVLFFLPLIALIWYFWRGEEPVSGGSDGRQWFRKKKEDWGPKPTERR